MADFDQLTSDDQQQINLELDEETAEGTYANLVMVTHSPEEFILDFIRMVPGVQKAKVKSRIIVTPQHAKRLVGALAENVERYEQTHGEIREPGGEGDGGGLPPMRFGGAGEA